MRTAFFTNEEQIERKWHLVDAEGQVLGRLATRVATLLRGKHKPIYTPNADTGDHVVVINAEKVRLTGLKWTDKVYHQHSGYPGGLRSTTAQKLRAEHPERLVEWAVKGMLPKNTLGKAIGRKLKVYAGPHHPHEAQHPVPFNLTKAKE
jgi:large subunit ribosomal protein L13